MRFLEYPAGAGGAALLLLRASTALLLVVVLGDLHHVISPGSIALYLVIALLVIGYATRLAAGICCVVSLALLLWWADVPVLLIVTHAMDAVALTLLGPGALSLDSCLHGRRTLSAFSTRSTKE